MHEYTQYYKAGKRSGGEHAKFMNFRQWEDYRTTLVRTHLDEARVLSFPIIF